MAVAIVIQIVVVAFQQVFFILLDLLLPLAALLFLLPLNPIFSSIAASSWTMAQLLISPNEKRWALWPMAMVILVMARTWWLNEMPHPASGQDLLLLVASFLAATGISKKRWTLLLAFPIGVLPLLLTQLSSKPWTPNPLVGPNQGAYLLGLILLMALGWCWKETKHLWIKFLSCFSSVLALFLIWQTASRAALASALIAFSFVFLRERARKGNIWQPLLLLIAITVLGIGIKQLLRPSSTGIPGLNLSSDLGRILIGQCYFKLPFSGSNRLLHGVGFQRPEEFCHQVINGGIADHAHNIYLQIWANSGLLGLVGLSIFAILLFSYWRQSENYLDPLPRRIGQAVLIYTLVQGCFDISLLHWPITQVFTGILLAIPFCAADHSNNSFSKPDWG